MDLSGKGRCISQLKPECGKSMLKCLVNWHLICFYIILNVMIIWYVVVHLYSLSPMIIGWFSTQLS